MSNRTVQHGSFTIERELAFPPVRVFAAWADRKAKEKWFAGPTGQWKPLERQITIEFEPAGEGTKLILTEQGAFLDGYDDAGSRERGTAGLLDALEMSLGGAQ